MTLIAQALFLTIFYIINIYQGYDRVIIPTIVSLVSTYALLLGSRLLARKYRELIYQGFIIDTLALSINYSCLLGLTWSTSIADSAIPFLVLASLSKKTDDKFPSPLRICTSLFHLTLAVLILVLAEKIPVLHVFALFFVAFAPALEILPQSTGIKSKISPATNTSRLSLAEKGILSMSDSIPSMPDKIPSYLKKQQVMVDALKKKPSYPVARRTSNNEGQMKITSDPKNSLLFRHSSLIESAARSDLGIIQETEKKHHYTTNTSTLSSTDNATDIILPIIQDLMDQTKDSSVLQALANVLEMLNVMAVDAETLLDRNMKDMLEKSHDPELKEYLKLEFNPKTKSSSNAAQKHDTEEDATRKSGRSFKNDSKSLASQLPLDLFKKFSQFRNAFDPKGWDVATLNIEDHPILFMGLYVFEETGVASMFQLDPELLVQFLVSIELHYHDENPYHNKFHGADVLQASFYLASVTETHGQSFSNLELLALVFAATVHDVDHPGLNNNFMEATEDPLAVLYNNQAVLENHHSCLAFKLHEKYPVCSKLSRSEYKRFRDLAVALVLSTDFHVHFPFISEFKGTMLTNTTPTDPKRRLCCLKMIVKSADISNCTRTTSIYLPWSNRICEEFFEQGDIEKDLGLPISPFMDRRTTQVHKSQIGFIDFVARPLISLFHAHFPIPALMANLEANKQHWETEGAKLKISLRVSVKVLAIARRKKRARRELRQAGLLAAPLVGENVDNLTFMRKLKSYSEQEKPGAAAEEYQGVKSRKSLNVMKATMAFLK